MTQDTEDVVARLRVQARHEETASKMMADAKTARQTDREDAWTDAGYSWTTAEQTASWRAADLIQSLSDRIDVRDEREVAIRYMDVLARELARDGKMDECAVLHAASNLLETLGGRAALHQEGIARGTE